MDTTQNPVWGWHLLIDCSGMDSERINSPTMIKDFVEVLVQSIDMVKIGDAMIQWCDTHEKEKQGYTFFQLIETSNIIGHLCSYDNTGFIDVWSCKDYDPELVLEIVKTFFKPEKTRVQFVHRIAP